MKNQSFERNIPTILVVLGATGDLMKKKIIPAVYNLHVHGRLPERFKVVGMSRRDLSDKDFQKFVLDSLKNSLPSVKKATARSVCRYFTYSRGDFSKAKSFENLKDKLLATDKEWVVCSNKLFYLAVPPTSFAMIFKNMAKAELNKPCGGEYGWSRVLIEKPFGTDEAGSKKLFELLGKYFVEEQLYLIDHYLTKEIVQAIKHFRFSNNLFEKSWDKHSIEKINIRLLEKKDVAGRGAFYDALGAFRDVGQNHLLQMLSVLTMDTPRESAAADMRAKRSEIIESLAKWTASEIKKNTFRAQYRGYTAVEDVKKKSTTETYFKLKTELKHPAWHGVSVVMEAGKALKEGRKEIEVIFRHPALCVACPKGGHIHNKVVFAMEPDESITIHFWTKKPGFEKELEERTINFFLYERKQKTQYVEEYAELLFNALIGEQSMFVSEREIMAEWRFTDPVIKAWQKNSVALQTYRYSSDEVISLAKEIGNVKDPEDIIKDLAIVGLGKMGANMARRMLDQGWRVVGYNRSRGATDELSAEGMTTAYSLNEVVEKLPKKKVVWLMVPAGKPVDEVLFGKDGLVKYLKKGDIIIDGGNSYFKDTVRRAKKLKKAGIRFLDCGTSGGPEGARRGACLMIGGEKKDFNLVENLFRDFATEDGYQFFPGAGAGHFVKMVHNGIEYGMMQAIAEGFNMMKKSAFKLDLKRVADVYNHGSVIESRLIGWLEDAFADYGEDLRLISGSIDNLGEGAWTVKTAHKMKAYDKVIHEALNFRLQSKDNPSYTGKIVSSLRGQFGGHPVLTKK